MTRTPFPQIVLVRHGETEWSLSGRHTSVTDISLTPNGEAEARRLGMELRGWDFGRVIASPSRRARRTCELAGFDDRAEDDPELMELRYGDYEGLKTAEIRRGRSDWSIFRDGCPGGESPEEVSARADRVAAGFRTTDCDVLVFSHAHFIRCLAVRWVGLDIAAAALFSLTTSAVSVLGFDHDRSEPVIRLWNDDDFRRSQSTRE